MSRTIVSRQRATTASIVIVAILAAGVVSFSDRQSRASTGAIPAPSAVEEYLADFSQGAQKGTGLRFTHLASSNYIDLRLKGFSKVDAQTSGKAAKFSPSDKLSVVYEASPDHVKESLIVSDRNLVEFRFAVSSSGLVASVTDGRITFSPPGQPWMFRLGEVVAADSVGGPISGALSLDGGTVMLRLDKEQMAKAVLPVTVDPTIEGVPSDATSGAHARRLFQTEDSRLILFYRDLPAAGPRIVYRISSDKGKTWGDAVTIAEGGPSGDLSAVQLDGDDFLISYAAGTTDLPRIGVRKLTKVGSSFTVGEEKVASAINTWWKPIPTLVARGEGPLGQNFMIGFRVFNSALSRLEYHTASSEDGGQTWLPSSTCATDTGTGTLAVQGARVICITAKYTDVVWRQLTQTGFGSPSTIRANAGFEGDPPSTALTDDGRLHVVTNSWTKVYYAVLEPAASSFTQGRDLGSGRYPAITTNGRSLFVFAAEALSSKESRINSWVATDGLEFNAGTPLGGETLDHVVDYNHTWAWRDEIGDGIFGLSGGASPFGNLIGTKTASHLLNAADKKIALGFVPSSSVTGATIDIKLFVTATATAANTPYRIGVRAGQSVNSVEVPSEEWLGEEREPDGTLSAGSFNVVTFSTAAPTAPDVAFDPQVPKPKTLTVSLPSTSLSVGSQYFVVAEPITDCAVNCPIYSDSVHMAVLAAGAHNSSVGGFSVQPYSSGNWLRQDGENAEVGRLSVSSGSTVLAAQLIGPSTLYPILEHQSPGESFQLSSGLTPTQAKVFLVAQGSPAPQQVTFTVINSTNQTHQTLWQSAVTATAGWNQVAVAGLELQQTPSHYRMVLTSANRDINNYYRLRSSGDTLTSFGGSTSVMTRGLDKPGYLDRSTEAKDNRIGNWDFWAFNTSSQDALYLGDDKAFDFAQLVRQATSATDSFATSFSYWNGASWASLTTTRNYFAGSDGSAEWTTPTDWATTTVNGTSAYWVKVSPGAGRVPVLVDRVTAIHNLKSPTVVPVLDADPNQAVALAYADLGLPAKVIIDLYDATLPDYRGEVISNPFTPNGDGLADLAHIGASFGENARWALSIESETVTGTVTTKHREVSGIGRAMGFTWDGKDKNQNVVPDGTYKAMITSVDDAGNAATKGMWVTKGQGPIITSVDTGGVGVPAEVGRTITITGSGFDVGLGTHGVNLDDGDSLYVVSWSPTQIVAALPANLAPGPHDLRIWEANTSSPPLTFTSSNYVAPTTTDDFLPGKIAFRVSPGTDPKAIAASVGDLTSTVVPMFPGDSDPVLGRWYLQTVTATMEAIKVKQYALIPTVEWAEVEAPVTPSTHEGLPDDAGFRSNQWALHDFLSPANDHDIDAPQAWDITRGLVTSTVAFIDSGISPHWDIASKIVTGTSYTGTSSTADGCIGTAIGSHGTQVAAIAEAVTNNTDSTKVGGMAGVAWNGSARPYKIFSNIAGQCVWAATAGTYLANVLRDATKDGKNDVVNMSFERKLYSQAEQDVIDAAWALNKVLVASAGNAGSATPVFPAAYDHVIAVGASDQQGRRATFSNYSAADNKWVDLNAPGVSIYTADVTSAGDGFTTVNGTSFASAFVAGTAALMKARTDSNAAIATAIVSSAGDSLTAYGALLKVVPAFTPNGVFFRNGGKYYLADRGKAKNITSAKKLNSWGVYDFISDRNSSARTNTVYLEDEQLGRLLKTAESVGFRPGSLVQIPADPLTFHFVSNDPRDPSANEADRWIRGKVYSLDAAHFASLGYKTSRVLQADPGDIDLAGETPHSSFTSHPNGSLLQATAAADSSMDIYMKDDDEFREIPGTENSWSPSGDNRNDWILGSWGMGTVFNLENDVVIPSPTTDIELSQAGPYQADRGPELGYRPGSTFELASGAAAGYWLVTLGADDYTLTDFARGVIRRFDDYHAFTCYRQPWPPTGADAPVIEVLYPVSNRGADLSC